MALVSAFVASCTAANDPSFGVPTPSYTDASGTTEPVSVDVSEAGEGTQNVVMSTEGTTSLPETVAYVPDINPADAFPAAPAATTPDGTTNEIASAPAASQTVSTPQAAQAAASDAQAQSAAAAVPPESPQAGKTGEAAVPADYPVYVTATDPNQPLIAPQSPKKRGFLASLFSTSEASAAPLIAPPSKALIPAETKPQPVIELASTGGDKAEVKTASLSTGDGVMDELDALPGVRKSALFEIKRKSGIDDDSDVDLHEEEDYGSVEVATAGGLARLAPNGLIKQTDNVDVACLKPSLVRMLKTLEQRYGRKLVVTSGYRSPERNRRARGAKNSLHMYCAAADVQVPGVSKWELANFVRSMPGRGGVGTYCHTNSVHVDVGPERDWNWRCRRRRG